MENSEKMIQNEQNDKDNKDNANNSKIHLIVKYVAGDYRDSFNIHQKIEHVFDKAVQHFQIDRTSTDKYGLFYNGALLENAQTIGHYSLADETKLILSVIQSGDIDG
ncbi:hypothetical protein [Sinanaerobacter chloroacetimidivorans]|uniref:Ubiquitin-like domain-containing protein n=1 Tax=Sinanaerobacter chloroacetimidivorans TaxID=2818044 RepID=A0A8J7W1C5_9FIRM|nr:hypothetical protein [Sinanaerobacter chloroacetimidivorans]MBR0598594.1 hypothetical protein [Sinanaerobacter chloroacetimidivorans]